MIRQSTALRTTSAIVLLALVSCGNSADDAHTSAPESAASSSAGAGTLAETGGVPPAPFESTTGGREIAEALPVELEGGILRTMTQRGNGRAAVVGDEVRFHFSSHLADSDKTLSSSNGWDEPCRVHLGAGEHVIVPGLERALAGLSAGARARIEVPAELAYGKDGSPASGIPAGAKLVFEVQIVGIRGVAGAENR